jgi:hypothetical protein
MRKNIFKRIMLLGVLAPAVISCEEDVKSTSQVTSFKEYAATLTTDPLVVSECEAGIYTLNFTFSSEDQITGVTAEIAVGESSTAEEGVDFDLETHEIELAAFEGQDGFSVDIYVYEDFDPADLATEDIYLVFTSETPTGISKEEVKVISITDSGEEPAIAVGSYTSTLNPDAAAYWFGISSPQSRTVTVAKTGTGTYSITDITSGAYNACCGLPLNQAAVIAITGCNEIRIASETGADVIGQSAKSLGTFDPETNTFTVYWADQYGSEDDTDPGALLFSTFVLQ